jgi:uncharacterized membrane protein YgdD (TMEM256/DUF423 family)
MGRALLAAGAVLGFVGVAAGAFGTHALGARIPEGRLATVRTAADYQLVHALAAIVSGLAAARWSSGWAAAAGWCFVAGGVVFCGSLYALALTDKRAWGAVTPIGGVAFLTGWALLVAAAIAGG